jgi:hypothetical protein
VGRPASNKTGLERTVKALDAAGRLDDTDQALLALARSLAAAVDAEPENAALAREYRAALVALSTAGADNIDDDTRQFLLTVRTPRAPMGDDEDAGA